MRRSVPSYTSSDTGCELYKQHYQTITAFNDYKTNNLSTEAVGNYISTKLGSDLAGNTRDLSAEEMQENIQTNLDLLQTLELKVYNMTRCLQKEITERSERAGDIYRIQDELTQEEKEAKGMEQTAKEAKERAKLLNNPYSKTNRHELWFPMGRPLKPQSVPVLLSIAIFFLILSLGMFLRLANIEFKLVSPLFAYVLPQRYRGEV